MTADSDAHIRHLAGKVLHHLERNRMEMSVLNVSFALRMWPWDVLMAYGWLASEDKIILRRRLAAIMAEARKK